MGWNKLFLLKLGRLISLNRERLFLVVDLLGVTLVGYVLGISFETFLLGFGNDLPGFEKTFFFGGFWRLIE